MNTPLSLPTRHRAFALVLTLAIVVLLTFLVIAFFISTSHDIKETRNFTDNAGSEQLASTTINLVVGQIRDATAGFARNSTGDLDLTQRLAWASQPGMIRNFTTSGSPHRYYKLYSSDALVVDSPPANFTDTPDATWYQKPALWTDLNEPVLVEDPAGGITANGLSYQAAYPIADPGLQTRGAATPAANEVQGFQIIAPSGYMGPTTSAALINYDPTTAPEANWAAMPVRWLYLLQDGTLSPANASGTNAQVANATSNNPIVGRVAFWTDDESAKVNLNTASEGVFWDIPRAYTQEEIDLGQFQPVRNEFQRFPGHPAMTSLSAVFPSIDPRQTGISATEQKERYQTLYALGPRVTWGGSEAGTLPPKNPTVAANAGLGGPMSLKTERLYASIGDAKYAPTIAGSVRALETLQTKLKTQAGSEPLKGLEDRDFFLTTVSRAPETNLWNLPRISLWPLNSATRSDTSSADNSRQSPYDRLIKFCTTIGKKDYFFLRANNWSGNYDFDQISRNGELYNYLSRFMSSPEPGFGGSYAAKYGASNSDGILTEMVDYIRSLPDPQNIFLATEDANVYYGYSNASPDKASYSWNSTIYSSNQSGFSGIVVPLKVTAASGNTKGFGCTPVITQASIVFRTESNFPTGAPSFVYTGSNNDNDGITVNTATSKVDYKVRAYLLVYFYNPTHRWGAFQPTNGTSDMSELVATDARNEPPIGFSVKLTNTSGFQIRAIGPGTGSGSFAFPTDPIPLTVAGDFYQATPIGASITGPERMLVNTGAAVSTPHVGGKTMMSDNRVTLSYPIPINPTTNLAYTGTETYNFTAYSGNTAVPTNFFLPEITRYDTKAAGYRFAFDGGRATLQFQIHNNLSTQPEVLQTVEVEFPSIASVIVPTQDYSPGKWLRTSSLPNASFQTSLANVMGGLLGPLGRLTWACRLTSTDGFKIVPGGSGSQNVLWNKRGQADENTIANTIVVKSVQLRPDAGCFGDWRLAGLRSNVPSSWFAPIDATRYASEEMVTMDHGYYPSEPQKARLVSGLNYDKSATASIRATSYGLNGAQMKNGAPGDWDNSYAAQGSGAFINPPDFGAVGRTPLMDGTATATDPKSYFNALDIPQSALATFWQYYTTFSPNRQVYSAMQLGSLPSEPYTEGGSVAPWQTLLFSPVSAAAANGNTHPGSVTPPDHLLADLFWMPVVDPYPISEPLSTAGKVNLNYQIQPFTNIKRRTAIHALLKNLKLFAIPQTDANRYKLSTNPLSSKYRNDIDIDATLDTVDTDVFNQGKIFRSATQISEVLLRPKGVTGDILTWWNSRKLTGDNDRETPYAQIHSRLTTKSNTFRVHYRVQILKKVPGTSPAVWEEGKDKVVGEQRGSALIERFIDPNDPAIPDFATLPLDNANAIIDKYYRFRVLQRSRFNP